MRVFIAIDVGSEVAEMAKQVKNFIGNDCAKIKWVERENLHITLKFLGEVEEETVKKIAGCLESIKFPPFSTNVEKFGVFPGERNARVLWLAPSDEDKFMNLHEKVEDALLPLGFRREGNFRAHVTIGRVKSVKNKPTFSRRIKNLMEKNVGTARVSVDEFALKKSTLTPRGPIYENVRVFKLGP